MSWYTTSGTVATARMHRSPHGYSLAVCLDYDSVGCPHGPLDGRRAGAPQSHGDCEAALLANGWVPANGVWQWSPEGDGLLAPVVKQ